MTLQERILEAIGEKRLTQRGLYDAMRGEDLGAVDAGLNALLRAGKVTRELGYLQRLNGAAAPKPAPTPPRAEIPRSAETAKPRELAPREREVYDLASKGLTRREIAARLSISPDAVSVALSNARAKLGMPRLVKPATKPALAAAASLPAAPSKEGAEAATVGAAPQVEVQKIDTRAITISPDAAAWLIELQRRTAEELQELLNRVAAKQADLVQIERLARLATAREGWMSLSRDARLEAAIEAKRKEGTKTC